MDNDLSDYMRHQPGRDYEEPQQQLKDYVDKVRRKWLADTEEKLEWFAGEVDHWKERCRELEIELVIAQGDFGSTDDINLDVFKSGWEAFNE